MRPMLVITRCASAAVSPSMRVWVAGSNATWPDTNTNPLASVATEYGPTGLGALVIEGTDLGMSTPWTFGGRRVLSATALVPGMAGLAGHRLAESRPMTEPRDWWVHPPRCGHWTRAIDLGIIHIGARSKGKRMGIRCPGGGGRRRWAQVVAQPPGWVPPAA